MTDNPLVSVIIPSFNHGRYIREAVSSVLSQSYDNIELLIVDDGSQDNTSQVLNEFAQNPSIRIFLNESNRGQSAVIKQGLEFANGEFISFLPSDDWYLPEKTQLQVTKFMSLPEDYGVVYARGKRYSMRSNLLREVNLPVFEGEILLPLLEHGNFIYPVTPMFRRNVLTANLFDENYLAVGEAIYNIVAISSKFAFVNQFVGVMRDHESNTGKDPNMRIYRDSIAFWTDFFERDDLPENAAAFKNSRIARIHLTRALSRLVQFRDFVTARELLQKAAQIEPKSYMNPRWLKGWLTCALPRFMSEKLLKTLYGDAPG